MHIPRDVCISLSLYQIRIHMRDTCSWLMNSNSIRIHIRPKIAGNSKCICSRAHGNRGSNQLRKNNFLESFQVIVALITSPDYIACVARRDRQLLQNIFREFI